MDITGWDTVVFTCRSPREVFRRVVAAVVSRWPGAIVERLDEPRFDPVQAVELPDDRLSSEKGHLLFVRDSAMAGHMDAVAYAPMADGDGPIAVIARPRRGVEFRIDRLEELRVVGEPEFPKVEPYAAWLCSPTIFEITVVTPDDPESHPFSIWICESVRQACCGDP